MPTNPTTNPTHILRWHGDYKTTWTRVHRQQVVGDTFGTRTLCGLEMPLDEDLIERNGRAAYLAACRDWAAQCADVHSSPESPRC